MGSLVGPEGFWRGQGTLWGVREALWGHGGAGGLLEGPGINEEGRGLHGGAKRSTRGPGLRLGGSAGALPCGA